MACCKKLRPVCLWWMASCYYLALPHSNQHPTQMSEKYYLNPSIFITDNVGIDWKILALKSWCVWVLTCWRPGLIHQRVTAPPPLSSEHFSHWSLSLSILSSQLLSPGESSFPDHRDFIFWTIEKCADWAGGAEWGGSFKFMDGA